MSILMRAIRAEAEVEQLRIEIERLRVIASDAAEAATEHQLEGLRLRAALIAVLPFIDDASDVLSVFPESAASRECRAAVVAAKAAIAKATHLQERGA